MVGGFGGYGKSSEEVDDAKYHDFYIINMLLNIKGSYSILHEIRLLCLQNEVKRLLPMQM